MEAQNVKLAAYDVIVDLGGDRNQQIIVRNCTAPEIAVLRKLHGEDAVTRAWSVREGVEVDVDDLYAIMTKKYGAKVVEELFPGGRGLVVGKPKNLVIMGPAIVPETDSEPAGDEAEKVEAKSKLAKAYAEAAA